MRKLATILCTLMISGNAAALRGDLEINSASEGLKRIQRDSFGVIRLPVLRRLAEKKRDITLEKTFAAQAGKRQLVVRVNGAGAEVGFHAEVPLEKRGADYDIDLAGVKKHAAALDVGFAEGHDFSSTGLTWQWVSEGFQCKLQYVDESYTSSLLSYLCRYETPVARGAVKLEGSALAHYLGVIYCVDSSYFDGGYTPGQPDREALMNVMLQKLSLPAYDEALMDVESSDSEAYMQGYSDCDEHYQFLAAEAEKLGIEPDF